jgi:hypothetical protein
MSSRQRLLTALNGGKPETIPCSFMLFNGLKTESHDYLDFIQKQLDLGLDAYIQIPPRPLVVKNDHYNLHGLPVSYHPEVTVKEWKETQAGQQYPILVKEYHTPAGVLRAEVRQDDEWRWGDHVPFLDDYLVGRSNQFIVDGPAELDALRYLLVPPKPEEIADFKTESAPILEFAQQNDILVAGGWGVGADLTGWVYGLHRLPYAIFDQPEFVAELLDIIAVWNRARMEVILQAGVDIFFKRTWYENCDNFTPRHFRKFIKPILAADAALAHKYDTKYGIMMTSNCMALLDDIADAGVDAIIGVDPEQWDLEVAAKKLGGRVCLWGGVNGHLTVELGTPEDVRTEVRRAVEVLAPRGGFILSPVDNVREYTPKSKANVQTLIHEWQQITGQ